jgi:hypothetical protein
MNQNDTYSHPAFDRKFFGASEDFTTIGTGELGGKARGLAMSKQIIAAANHDHARMIVNIPRLTVITTTYFDTFMQQNDLYDAAYSDTLSDHIIAHKFQQADLPVMMLGDLRSLIEQVHSPLAIRSSSLLEDAMYEPFAGIYETKMIPNNQPSPDTRFLKLTEAIKFVYASTFFKRAKAYLKATRHSIGDEKMAVIIQEVVGMSHGKTFYPNISGVARSYNFYPIGKARAQDGVVNLALGLGKTIVDDGTSWLYSPPYPDIPPPYGSPRDLLKQTQLHFWAVNMGRIFGYDPLKETEYLLHAHIMDAEPDGTLEWLVSTYDLQSDRITPGIVGKGPKIVTFAPILTLHRLALNEVIISLFTACKKALGHEVEIEFAVTFDPKRSIPPRFGLLQVRPIVVSHDNVEIAEAEFVDQRCIVASDCVLGNGTNSTIQDIIYVKPQTFDAKNTRRIAEEIAMMNDTMVAEVRPYLLIGFGRWGSSDPWLGIPVNWSHINGVQAIVEATLPQMNPDLSQGSHFFHNMTSFQVVYFSVKHAAQYQIDWEWLDAQAEAQETPYVRHVRLMSPLCIKVDGKTGRGVVLR